ncbi:MAG: VOC family protein [Alphaproteobacteria bacterium]
MSGAAPQHHAVRGIDHVFLRVAGLEAAACRHRLGFTLRAKGLHSAHKGTANLTIVLRGQDGELLGVVTPTPADHAAPARGEEGCKVVTRRLDGARRRIRLAAAVDDPDVTAAADARLFAEGVALELDGGAEVRTGDARVSRLIPAALAAAYPGLARPKAAYSAHPPEVVDLEVARRVLAGAGVGARPTAQGGAVAPADAAGAIVEVISP